MNTKFIELAEKKRVKKILEKDIEMAFVNWAKDKNIEVPKLALLYKRSFPDRTILLPGGQAVFIEFKRKGKPLTQNQKEWANKIKSLGFPFFVCDEIGQAERIITKLIKGRK